MKVQRNACSLLTGVLLLALAGCGAKAPSLPAEKLRDLANAYYNQELFKQSVDLYKKYLDEYNLSADEQANISYTIANIYFDRMKSYDDALAYYLRVKHLYPESDLVEQSERRIVECLERLQRSADAQQALREATFLDESKVQKKRPGVVVAHIGDREFTSGDLEFEMKSLPPYMLAQLKDPSNKVEALKLIIANELLFNTAKRKGLDRDRDVVEGAYQAKKYLMIQKLLQEELSSSINFEEDDLRTFYRANIAQYTVKNDSTGAQMQLPFEQARAQVTQDFIRSKQQAAYQRLVERMMRAENVKIYEDKIK